MKTTTNNKSWITGLTAAIAASLCCITPVIAFLGGASGVASTFSWVEPYRPYLIGVTALVFAFAWYQQLKPGKQEDCGCETNNKKSFWQSTLFLGIVTVVAALLTAFPYYAHLFYPKPPITKTVTAGKAGMQQVVFEIEGMTCESCTAHVNSALAKVKGVIQFQTSYEKANSTIKFDSSKTNITGIAAAINNTGYKVISQAQLNN